MLYLRYVVIFVGILLCLLVLFPFRVFGNYIGQQKVIADSIIEKSQQGGFFSPLIETRAVNNIKGKADVYRDEYGVCILVNNQELYQILDKMNDQFRKVYPKSPRITPHITLIQGVFRDDSFEKLKEAIKNATQKIFPEQVVFNDYFTQVGSNVFLDVKEGKDFLNKLNQYLTDNTSPNGPMKQVIDDIKLGIADLSEMKDGGAWRDFNIPKNNRPHITVIYGVNDHDLVEKSNVLVKGTRYSFIPEKIYLFKIDENGNLYGDPVFSANFDSKSSMSY